MSAARYRFLPWTRRGLIASAPLADDPAVALPARASVRVGITVSTIGEQALDPSLYGPGDVLGVDPRMIVRTDPRPGSSDVEPNYFPSIDFDPPDFPWLFTPAGKGANDRLRPWCVLIVVDRALVAAPAMERGRPLPTIEIRSDLVASELPDLRESWAWAHAQLLTESASPDLAAELAAQPALNVSRLIAPRRLQPEHHYAACLVPAFDVGVVRGLGGIPDPNAPARPAWDVTNPGDRRLPVYFHWEFATGPAGDFESLARSLRPYKASEKLGREPMYIGDAGPGMPSLAPSDPSSRLEMDGALRAPALASGSLADVPAPFQQALQEAVDAPAQWATGSAGATTKAVGPPIYGQWHAKQHRIPPDRPAWLRELNLDPRARAAAGLGAEVIRANQDTFLHWCWEQVGRILEANALLSRARLAMEAAARLHKKHYQPLAPDRLLQLSGPVHGHVLHKAVTVRRTVETTSLPNAASDPALRRLTSPQRPVLKASARRAGAPVPPSRAVRTAMIEDLAAGRLSVDPSDFVPGGLLGVTALSALSVPASGDAAVDLEPTGLPIQLPASQVRRMRAATVAAAAEPRPTLSLRGDLGRTGLFGEAHLARVREFVEQSRGMDASARGVLQALGEAARDGAGASAYLLTETPDRRVVVDALDVDAAGRVMARTPAGRPGLHVASLDPRLRRTAGREFGGILAELPPGALDRATRRPGTIAPGVLGRPVVERPAAPVPVASPVSVTVRPPLLEPVVVARVEAAFRRLEADGVVGPPARLAKFIAFDLEGVRATLLGRLDPRVTVRARVATMLRSGSVALRETEAEGRVVRPSFDHVMAYPELDVATYTYLATLDRSRFLPGVEAIPSDAITLVETNPRFVEAFLIGLNHEMNRELLWRSFPTEQRGTPFRRFWAWSDGGNDIEPLHEWSGSNALGRNGRAGPGGQIVLLIRGRLLRRYPNTAVYAWRASGKKLVDPPGPEDVRTPVFWGQFEPDFTFAGFDLTDSELLAGDGWFFVLQQQPTEPRFGFDEAIGGAPATLGSWLEASWAHVGTPAGAYLRIAGNPLDGVTHGGVTFVTNAAHLAALSHQRFMRVAVHAGQIVAS